MDNEKENRYFPCMIGLHFALNLIKPSDRVLDIGGSAKPFRRANAAIDIMPYEKRESKNSRLKAIPELFTKDTWITQDISDSKRPFPFKDKEFDFVVCSHVLEDLRDPFFVISEIQRVAKRGYIEVPSRFNEQLKGVENKRICGHSHHRWLIDLRKNQSTGQNELVFVHKNHLVHADRRFYIRRPWHPWKRFKINPNYEVLGFYFNGPFRAYEDVFVSMRNSESFMAETLAILDGKNAAAFWNREAPFPVESVDLDDAQNIWGLQELGTKIKKQIPLFNSQGDDSPELLDYEKQLLGKLGFSQ